MPVKAVNTEDPAKEQKLCKVCKTNTTNLPQDQAVECDVCEEWICFTCSGVSQAVYDIATQSETTVDYICKPCKEDLPHIRELVTIKQKQNELIEQLKAEVSTTKRFRQQQQNVNQLYDRRIIALEEIVRDKNLADATYPTLQKLTGQAQNLEKVLLDQKTLAQKVKAQDDTLKENKRIEDKENNLIVYGIPETENDEANQMKVDYATVKYIYNTKATLSSRDLTQITRLGTKTDDEKIRPIKLTFANQTKRLEILRNNKNLVLEHDAFTECTLEFCDEKGSKHNHIYVSPDKTKQQREDEKKLREELKKRKLTEKDLIIRNGKIIKKTTRARWADFYKDEY